MTMWVPKKAADGFRWYGKWAGNPNGHREDRECCVYEVSGRIGWGFAQCSRKRGHGPDGLFCKQHAKKAESSQTPALEQERRR